MCVLPAPSQGLSGDHAFPAGSNFEIHQKLKKYILDKGLSDLKDPKSFAPSTTIRGSTRRSSRWKRSAPRRRISACTRSTAKRRNGASTSRSLREASRELGATGLEQPLKLSVKDHEAAAPGKVLQWEARSGTSCRRLGEVRPRSAAPLTTTRCSLRQGKASRSATHQLTSPNDPHDIPSFLEVDDIEAIYVSAAGFAVCRSSRTGFDRRLLGANGPEDDDLKAISNLLPSNAGR